ncbi:RRP15-like protein [Chloropicon roscoffensis]|uniref:RRP15-like protein n=1 Tax=Chloropicon roscoffensis TaxID=1461544 RepID=A0A7S3FQV0_9CHLO
MEDPSTSAGLGGDAEDNDVQINIDIDQGVEDAAEGDKSAGKRKSMASAFAKIVGKKSKGSAGPILAEGKVLNRDEDRAAKELRKKILSNRKQKLEMRERGHVTAVQPGANAEQDALERALVRTATKGVVKLFNAIHQAQRQHRRAEGDRQKTAEAKENLMDQLEGAARNVSKIEGGSKGSRGKEAGQAAGGAGWDVLRDGFTGLSGRTKLKDWDKEEEDELELEMETIQESEEEEEEEI